MSFNYRIIKDKNTPHGTLVAIHSVYYNKEGGIEGWSANPEILTDDEEVQLAKNLILVQQALLRPVLELVKDEHGLEVLVETSDQPNIWDMPEGDHWRKAVIYRKGARGVVITHRRKVDKPFWVKIRDYSEPISAFKATTGVQHPFYYVARGDGLIVATFTSSQVVKEKPIDTNF